MLAPAELANRLFLGMVLLFLCYGSGFLFMQLKFPEKTFSKRFVCSLLYFCHRANVFSVVYFLVLLQHMYFRLIHFGIYAYSLPLLFGTLK